ncbi:DUF4890 domain-containing protein [Arcticibacterium luteifluviistationis]|uniref:DUF4890 domain-containing protein n=1 Tax=Arcticibacterium luteifluviistationis TaxID=1784714 RepID=A0A2Z4GE41_9BACT|nr:DUF4890 domain-containing protein [Arcticibacterium luteifluviistationis]AWV99516.1 hypothetical protein DJ013_15625 [Arcticibacterium luteifluviistationis]
MKKLIIAAALVIAAAGSSFAQRPEQKKVDPKERAEKMSQKLKSDLSLNEDQYAQILALNTAKTEKLEANKDLKKEEMKAKHEAMKVEREAYNANLKEILTQEQYIKFLEMKTEQKGEMRRKHAPRKRMKKEN